MFPYALPFRASQHTETCRAYFCIISRSYRDTVSQRKSRDANLSLLCFCSRHWPEMVSVHLDDSLCSGCSTYRFRLASAPCLSLMKRAHGVLCERLTYRSSKPSRGAHAGSGTSTRGESSPAWASARSPQSRLHMFPSARPRRSVGGSRACFRSWSPSASCSRTSSIVSRVHPTGLHAISRTELMCPGSWN